MENDFWVYVENPHNWDLPSIRLQYFDNEEDSLSWRPSELLLSNLITLGYTHLCLSDRWWYKSDHPFTSYPKATLELQALIRGE